MFFFVCVFFNLPLGDSLHTVVLSAVSLVGNLSHDCKQ